MHVGRVAMSMIDRPMCLPAIPQAGRAMNEAAHSHFSRVFKERFGVPIGTLGIWRIGHSTYDAVQLETQ